MSLTVPRTDGEHPEQFSAQTVLHELKTLEEQLSSDTFGSYVAPLESRRRLQALEREQADVSAIASIVGIASIATLPLIPFSASLFGLLLAWKPLTRLQKVSRLIKVISFLLEEFQDVEIETLPLIPIPGRQPLDLFIRFPDKKFLAFSMRSFGESTIVYDEEKQALFCKRGYKGRKRWEPDPTLELSDQVYWLRKNRRELFGSSRGARKPVAKVVVVCGKTRLENPHDQSLYVTVGQKKFLLIAKEGGACFVIHQSQVVDFVRSYIAEQHALAS